MSFDGKIIFPYAEEKSQTRKSPAKKLSFKSLGIPVGSTLVFVGDESLCVKTVDDSSQVEYSGEVKSLSSMTRFLFEKIGKANKSGAYQGGVYFKYNNKKLIDIRKEKEKSEV